MRLCPTLWIMELLAGIAFILVITGFVILYDLIFMQDLCVFQNALLQQ